MKARDYAHALYDALDNVDEKKRSDITEAFVEMLPEKGRGHLLREITHHLEILARKETRRREIIVTTPAKISTTEAEKLVAHHGEFSEITNPIILPRTNSTLIGGYTIQSHDTLVDTSHKKKLQSLYRTLSTIEH